MRWPLHLCGTIHDLTLSVSWDRSSLIAQVDRRVGKLCDLGIMPGRPKPWGSATARFTTDCITIARRSAKPRWRARLSPCLRRSAMVWKRPDAVVRRWRHRVSASRRDANGLASHARMVDNDSLRRLADLGLTPPSCRPCSAHNKKPGARPGS